MVGAGMIFDETYRPFFESSHRQGLYDRRWGVCELDLAGIASRTGRRAEAYRERAAGQISDLACFREPNAVGQLLATDRPAWGRTEYRT